MSREFEDYIKEAICGICEHWDKIEVQAFANDKSYSLEFWVTSDGNRLQCMEMIDRGMLSERKYSEVSKRIIDEYRKQKEFIKETVNHFSMSFESSDTE